MQAQVIAGNQVPALVGVMPCYCVAPYVNAQDPARYSVPIMGRFNVQSYPDCAQSFSCKGGQQKLQNKRLGEPEKALDFFEEVQLTPQFPVQHSVSVMESSDIQRSQARVQSLGCKREQRKLQNKKLEKLGKAIDMPEDTPQPRTVLNQDVDDLAVAIAHRKDQQLLRLALAALVVKCNPSEAQKCDDALTERTLSTGLQSTFSQGSTTDGDSLLDAPWPPRAEEPRIGIDIGDVLTSADNHSGTLWDVPGSVEALRAITEIFGSHNVFLVSKVRVGGWMHQRTEEWLHGPRGFLEKVGIPAENVRFVSRIKGRDGKGIAALNLGLSHFVDNKFEVLESIFTDEAGNSREFVQKFDGILFHFASGGTGQWKPRPPQRVCSKLGSHYYAVSGWSAVVHCLRQGTTASLIRDREVWKSERTCHNVSKIDVHADKQLGHSQEAKMIKSVTMPAVLVHRISVGIHEDPHFGVVHRLIGADEENFKYITSTTGAKVILNGQGSPHPQPRTFEQEVLTICIRAKSQESLQEAIALVEELLSEIHQEHHDFTKVASCRN